MDKNKYVFPIIIIGIVIAVILIIVLAGGQDDEDSQNQPSESEEQATDADTESPNAESQDAQQDDSVVEEVESATPDNGLVINTLEQGEGEGAQSGDRITVHYEGRLTDENGDIFDSSYEREIPFDFVLGQGSVIAGWDQGLLGTKVGQVLTLTIPPELGYGEQGAGESIPPNSTLFFEIEVVDIASS